jgi:hypothetical protein
MLKMLSLIGMLCVGSLCAAAATAAALPPAEDLDTQLRNAQTRAINATAFEIMAAQSVMADGDVARGVFNADLLTKFKAMEDKLGASPLFSLKTIDTQENAKEACPYYTGVKNHFSSLVQTLTKSR